MTFLMSLILSSSLYAQTVGVKVDDASAGETDTTITIKKGPQVAPGEVKYEITEDADELSGDPAPLQKEARKNWQKACNDWKKELKELNTDNKILTMNCGKADCTTSAMETVCKSTTKSKIRVRMN